MVYRGVFDYPHVHVGSLAHFSSNCTKCTNNSGCDKPAADPPNTSKHILEFMGWSAGKKPQYLGRPAGRVLTQEAKWEQLWLRKGRNEDERRRKREAEKARVSTQEQSRG